MPLLAECNILEVLSGSKGVINWQAWEFVNISFWVWFFEIDIFFSEKQHIHMPYGNVVIMVPYKGVNLPIFDYTCYMLHKYGLLKWHNPSFYRRLKDFIQRLLFLQWLHNKNCWGCHWSNKEVWGPWSPSFECSFGS